MTLDDFIKLLQKGSLTADEYFALLNQLSKQDLDAFSKYLKQQTTITHKKVKYE